MTTNTWIILASIFILTLVQNLSPALCFVHVPLSFTKSTGKITATLIQSSNNKEDEIAELEAKLRQLKQEQQMDEQAAQQQEEEQAVATATYTPPSNANGDRNIDESPLDEMLSESWKENEVDEGGGSIIGSLVTGLVLLVSFVALSQIPVGQEGLDKYSTAKPSTTIDLGDKNPNSKSDLF